MKTIDGRTHRTCPVCGVHHFTFWEDTHELTWDKEICEGCADWEEILIPIQLSEMEVNQ